MRSFKKVAASSLAAVLVGSVVPVGALSSAWANEDPTYVEVPQGYTDLTGALVEAPKIDEEINGDAATEKIDLLDTDDRIEMYADNEKINTETGFETNDNDDNSAEDTDADDDSSFNLFSLFSVPTQEEAPEARVGAAPFEADGNKIESINIKWLSSDAWNDGDPDRLSISGSSISAKAQIDAQLSGQNNYDVGDIQIEIPKNVFYDRTGSRSLGNFSFSVPAAPDARAQFAYSEFPDSFILTNTKVIPAATSMRFEFTISNISALDVNGNANDLDESNLGKNPSQPLNATISVRTYADSLIARQSGNIDAVIDTSSRVTSASTTTQEMSTEVPFWLPSSLRPESADDYVYIRWYSWAYVSGNQPYSMTFNASISGDGNGRILGYSTPNGNIVLNTGNATSLSNVDLGSNLRAFNSTQYVSIYAAYEKALLPDEGSYRFDEKTNYTLTSLDDQQETTEESSTYARYSPTSWTDPEGHFDVYKFGGTTYPGAINRLVNRQDQIVSFDVETIGIGYPWTKEKDSVGNSPDDYGKRSYKMVTEDTGVKFDHDIVNNLTANDFEFDALEFGPPTYSSWGIRTSGTYWGTWAWQSGVSGSSTYTVYGKTGLSDEWVAMAELSHKSSTGYTSRAIYPGTTASKGTISLPPNTVTWKVEAVTKEPSLDYHIYPQVKIKASDRNINRMLPLLYESDIPKTMVRNTARSENYEEDGTLIVECTPKNADDYLEGIGQGASMEKETVSVANDTSNQTVKLSYTMQAKIASNIITESDYSKARMEGLITSEGVGRFWDLLPLGVDPDTSSVHGANKEQILGVEAFPDWRGSGRTMLVVDMEANGKTSYMSPSPLGKRGYGDCPGISFDAYLSWANMAQYGNRVVNVAAYESMDNNIIGTVKNLVGEPDDPYVGNNQSSQSAVSGTGDLLVGLDPDRENANSFVYARSSQAVNVNTASLTSISKSVSVNGRGIYTDGLDDAHPQNVYEGGIYTYRIGMMNDNKTIEKDIVFYDSLENYVPTKDKKTDHGDKQWKGTITGIDVSSLVNADIAPVVYWSDRDDLVLDDRDNADDRDLSNSDIWHKWTNDMTAEQKQSVRAVAVDASMGSDGGKYALEPETSIHFDIHMKAPTGKSLSLADGGCGAKSERENYYDTALGKNGVESGDNGYAGGAHSYNNVVMISTHIDTENGKETTNQLVRKDYTKVGLLSYPIVLQKIWNDDNNNDGVRPDQIQVDIMRGEEKLGSALLNESANWTVSLDDLAMYDHNGRKINYSFIEHGSAERAGAKVLLEDTYETSLSALASSNGYVIKLTNTHEPETTEISGTKTWAIDERCSDEDAAGETAVRPGAIKLDIYADGEFYQSKIVSVGCGDIWDWTIGNLPKWNKGKLIEYTVEEDLSYLETGRYYTSVINENNEIVNTYYPYGDIVIEKAASNKILSDKNKETEFSFMLELERDRDGEMIPDADTYAVEIVDSEEDVIREETATNGSVILLRIGEKARIKNVPTSDEYSVSEINLPTSWSISSKKNEVGYVRSGDNGAQVVFTNVYKATGKMFLAVVKRLENRDLEARQFMFRLTDDSGKVIRSAANVKDGGAHFGAVSYNESDIGKTYEYELYEEDRGLPGYSYASGKIRVLADVEDNGDGTLTVSTRYEDENGNPIDSNSENGGELDGNGAAIIRLGDTGVVLSGFDENVEVPVFTNSYHASGSLVMKAFKDLKGRELKDGEFEFSLVEIDDAGSEVVGGVELSARNDAAGTIEFSPIEYDEFDIGQSYRYRVSEVPGGDESVVYDDYSFVYDVTVYDNGDGTLSFDQVIEKSEDELECEPVFRNTLRPGGLVIQKEIDPEVVDGDWDPNTEFEFEVQLEGDDVKDGVYDYELSEHNEPTNWGEAFAIYTIEGWAPSGNNEDGTLRFYRTEPGEYPPLDQESYDGHKIDAIYTGIEEDGYEAEWSPIFNNNESIVFSEVEIHDEIAPKSLAGWFAVDGWTNNMIGTLYGGGFIGSELDLSLLDTSQVTSMYRMFELNGNPTVRQIKNINIKWNTFNVTNMSGMFSNCNIIDTVDVSGWDTSNVTNMSEMFKSCKSLSSLDVSGWDTSNVKDMSNMFTDCKSLQSVDVSGWDTSNVTDMSNMFNSCSSLCSADVSSWDTRNVTNMSNMFAGCSSLESLEVGNWNTNSVTNVNGMFNSCSSLLSLDVSGWDLGNVPSVGGMFCYCSSLQSLDLSGWDTSNVTSMSSMFWECSSLSSVDLSGWDTSNVTNMDNMFNSCSSLLSLDLSNWDTGNVTSMSTMFTGCFSLESLSVGDWNTSSVTSLWSMFSECSSLESLDVSGWDTSKVKDMSNMFAGCSSLHSLDLSGWDTSKVKDMSIMFSGCSSLQSVNIGGWDTSNVTSMECLFAGCSSLQSLDLSSWDTRKVRDMSFIFDSCYKLFIIYISENWSIQNVSDSYNMFEQCSCLVGGAGTTYDSSHIDKEYARVDNPPDEPGYFTYKAAPTSTPSSLSIESVINDERLVNNNNTISANSNGNMLNTNASEDVIEQVEGSSGVPVLDYFFGSDTPNANAKENVNIDNTDHKDSRLSVMYDVGGVPVGSIFTIENNNNSTAALLSAFARNSIQSITADPLSEMLDDNMAFAIYSSDDNSLRFYNNRNDMPEEGNIYNGLTVDNIYKNIEHLNTSNEYQIPWKEYARQIEVIEFVDKIYPRSMAYWFSGIMIEINDYTNLDTSLCTNMQGTFQNYGDGWYNDYDENNNYIHENPFKIDISTWDTSYVEDMSYMFAYAYVDEIKGIENLDTGRVKNFYSMFSAYSCSEIDYDEWPLTWDVKFSIRKLDLSKWDTKSAEDMSYMFGLCTSGTATSHGGIASYEDDSIPYTGLEQLNMSGWDTSNVTTMSYMFYCCRALIDINMSGWDTSNVSDFGHMFASCCSLSNIDLSCFTTDKVTRTSYMFYECSLLKTIYVSDNWDLSNDTGDNCMFAYCYNLAGGEGTKYKYDYASDVDKTYARIDTLPDSPGYFTYKLITISSISYNSNGGTGSMSDQQISDSITIPVCSYYYMNHRFICWNTEPDGSGTSYYPGDIPENIIDNNESITLYAQWEKIDQTINIKDGRFTIKLRANEKAYIPDLPAGTTYTIREINNNSGWSLSREKDSSGVIQSLVDSTATFQNTYQPGQTTVSLQGLKTFDSTPITKSTSTLSKEPFNFTLVDDNEGSDSFGQELETVVSNDIGLIKFKDLTFTQAGTYHYKIKENKLMKQDVAVGAAVSHTPNINPDTRENNGGYDDNRNDYDTITIPGADYLMIDVDCETESTNYYWLVIKTGNKNDPDSTKPLGGSRHTETGIRIEGDTATFHFKSDRSASNYYGYYATITGYQYRTVPREDIIFDEHEEHVRIDITDAGHGYLTANVIYEDSDNDTDERILFNNQSAPEQPATLQLTKNLPTPALTDQSFTFRITFSNPTIQARDVNITVPAGESTATLDINDLPLHEEFTITEILSSASPWKLVSTDPEDMTFTLDSGQVASAVFTNEYSAVGSFAPEAIKTMTGAVLTGGEFTFAVYDDLAAAESAVETGDITGALTTSVNASDNHVYFDAITVNNAGEHTFYIVEVPNTSDNNADDAGSLSSQEIVYDGTVYRVVVSATDNGDGTLSCQVSYADPDGTLLQDEEQNSLLPVFENSIAGGKLVIEKRVAGVPSGFESLVENARFDVRVWFDDKNSATEDDNEGAESASAGAAASDDIVYRWVNVVTREEGYVSSGSTVSIADGEKIEISIPSGIDYRIEEQDETDSLFRAVYENQSGTITSGSEVQAIIENQFDPSATVSLKARKITEGFNLAAEQFSFVLTDENGVVIDEIKNNTNGEIIFPEMSIKFPVVENDDVEDEGGASVLGSVVYRVYEVEDGQVNITYDSRYIEARVEAVPESDGSMGTVITYYYNGVNTPIPDGIPAFHNSSRVSLPITGLFGIQALMILGLSLVLLGLGFAIIRYENKSMRQKHQE